ncbi:hypothetical protein CASFOL_012307 [Castilleja foliolosa]|uniref:Pentatricopeptide repeat-containing protein n=1 Tax=Castilleja foliolosa TaxID=1961234 RepID=A0ABD3DQ67_9LAMI
MAKTRALKNFCFDSPELWYNAILILLTGNLKNARVEINALSICLNINCWEMMISLGFMAAASENGNGTWEVVHWWDFMGHQRRTTERVFTDL